MNKKLVYSLVLGGTIRYLLSISKYSKSIENRVEVSTPLNSFKRLQEGVYLYENDVDPYQGDLFHENPLILLGASFLLKYFSDFVSVILILLDLLSAIFIFYGTKEITRKNYKQQQEDSSSFAENTKEIRMQEEDEHTVPLYCALAYIFNPYTILNCVGMTTTIWSNFVLSVMLFTLAKKQKLMCLVALALETQKNIYPAVLIVPVALSFSESSKSKIMSRIFTVTLFAGMMVGLQFLSFTLMSNWNFLEATYDFNIHCRDLTPNIGLFWYFFTEMFDHFRDLFLYTFQLNTAILYLFPLSYTFKDCPEFLLTVLLALITIFRSYPCVGDIALYMSLIPLWKRVAPFMSHNFIVIATFLVTSILGPTVYHLWMQFNSANANFYFGVTLSFCTANIFLLTDLTFAYLKMKFCLENGVTFDKTMKLSLE